VKFGTGISSKTKRETRKMIFFADECSIPACFVGKKGINLDHSKIWLGFKRYEA